MKRSNKKGFTIVELVIVIAVVAILAAVLIPTFSGIVNKANVSNDNQLVKNLNTAVASQVGGVENIQQALAAAEEFGYNVAKINAKAKDNEILWDAEHKVFCYLNDGKVEYIPEHDYTAPVTSKLWIIDQDGNGEVSNAYSSYVINVAAGTTITAHQSIDVTACEGVNVTYTSEGTVSIYTNGGNLTVTNEKANVYHYGVSDEVIIGAVANASYHEFGKANFTQVNKGHYVMEKGGATIALVVASGVTVDDTKGGDIVAKYENPANVDDIKLGATLFAGGSGSESDPYLIANAAHMQNIGKNYENGYAYYKVAEGVEAIDCSNWSSVKLNGCFDGNNIVFDKVDAPLFGTVGSCTAEGEDVVISNFVVKFEGGAGIVRNCGTSNLTFENVTASGYLIGDWNMGVFLRYGTQNVSDNGFNYEVNFVNCASSAEIYATSNDFSAILVGHAYEGKANSVVINVDAATEAGIATTKLYYTGKGAAFGYKYFGAKSNVVTVNVEGVDAAENKVTGANVIAINSTKSPTKDDNGNWAIATESDTAKVVIKLNWQYTLWTDGYAEKIPDQSGVGGNIGEEIVIDVVNGESVKALDKITSVEIITGSDKWDYEIADGKLILYMLTTNENVDGNVSLVVEQYTAGSSIARYTGRVNVASKTQSADWIIK